MINLEKKFNLSTTSSKILSGFLSSKNFPSAILITGGKEKDREALSIFIAKAILCTDDHVPCGKCRSCKKADESSNPDILFYEKDKDRKTFSVEICKRITSDSIILPNECDYKVSIIKDADLMESKAQNSLLKTLEEPPQFDFFILTAKNCSTIIDTVKSRVCIFELSGGEKTFTKSEIERAEAIAEALMQKNEYAVLKSTLGFKTSREFFQNVIDCLCEIFADSLKIKFGSADNLYKPSQQLSKVFSKKQLYTLFEKGTEISGACQRNGNINLLINFTVSSLSDCIKSA